MVFPSDAGISTPSVDRTAFPLSNETEVEESQEENCDPVTRVGTWSAPTVGDASRSTYGTGASILASRASTHFPLCFLRMDSV